MTMQDLKILNPKSEILNKLQILMVRLCSPLVLSAVEGLNLNIPNLQVWNLENWEIRICLEFRYSDLVLSSFWILICNFDFCILIFRLKRYLPR